MAKEHICFFSSFHIWKQVKTREFTAKDRKKVLGLPALHLGRMRVWAAQSPKQIFITSEAFFLNVQIVKNYFCSAVYFCHILCAIAVSVGPARYEVRICFFYIPPIVHKEFCFWFCSITSSQIMQTTFKWAWKTKIRCWLKFEDWSLLGKRIFLAQFGLYKELGKKENIEKRNTRERDARIVRVFPRGS